MLRVQLPVNSPRFQKILEEEGNKGCDMLLCPKCYELIEDMGLWKGDISKIERKIDAGIRRVQNFFLQFQKAEGMEESSAKEGGKKKKGTGVSSSVTADYRHFLTHFSNSGEEGGPLSGGSFGSCEESKPHGCDLFDCDHRFFLEINLELHTICYHDSNLVLLTCHECGDVSSQSWGERLSHPIQVHRFHKTLSCKSCSIESVKPEAFLEHVKVHELSERLQCSECSSKYSQMEQLRLHFDQAHAHLFQPSLSVEVEEIQIS